MEGAAADVSTRDVEVLGRAASMEVGFSVEEDEGTALTGRKPSVTLSSISENEGLEKVGRGLGTVAVSGGIEVSGINVGGIDIGRTGAGRTGVGGTGVGGTGVKKIKVGEVKTCGVGVYGVKIYGAETGTAGVYIALEGPSSLFFSTPFIASSSCFSASFRVFHFKVRFAAFSFSRRFVTLLYFFFFTKSLPFKAIAIAGQL